MIDLKFLPVNGRILVEVQKEDFSVGGVALPETRDEKPEVGIILAVDKKEEHPLNGRIKVGSKIIFNKFAATVIRKELVSSEDKKEYLIMTKDGILAIYNGDGSEA